MLGTRTLRAVVVITLVVMAVPVGAERGPFAQLPEEWRQLFPAETEVLDLGLLPVIQEAPGNTPTPFALPGTAHVIMVPEVYYEGTTGALEGVAVTYRLEERSTWTATGRELLLWAAEVEVGVRRYDDEATLAEEFADFFDPVRDIAVQLGDQAFLSHRAEKHEHLLGVRAGRHGISLHLTLAPGALRPMVHEPLRKLVLRWAELIVERVSTEAEQSPASMPLAEDSAVRRALVCQGVDEDGELVGCTDSFPAGTEKVMLYLEMVGARPNTEIQVTWYHDDDIIGRELLLVSGDRRSLSYLYARGRATLWSGSYAAEISENGRLVGRLVFRVEGED